MLHPFIEVNYPPGHPFEPIGPVVKEELVRSWQLDSKVFLLIGPIGLNCRGKDGLTQSTLKEELGKVGRPFVNMIAPDADHTTMPEWMHPTSEWLDANAKYMVDNGKFPRDYAAIICDQMRELVTVEWREFGRKRWYLHTDEDLLRTAHAEFSYVMKRTADSFQDPVYVMPPRASTMVEEINPKGMCDEEDVRRLFSFASYYESIASNRASIARALGFIVLSYEQVFYNKMRHLRRNRNISHMYGDLDGEFRWALTMENIIEVILEMRHSKGEISESTLSYLRQLDGVLSKASLSPSQSNVAPAQAASSVPLAGTSDDERLETRVTPTAALLSSNAPDAASDKYAFDDSESGTVAVLDDAKLEDSADGGGGVRVVALALKERG